jgi:tRNA-dihydrouridine synthase B
MMTHHPHPDGKEGPVFYLAPIRGITNRIYRNCFADLFGEMDTAITPFIQTAKGHLVKPVHLVECDPAQNHMPIIPQIIGRDPDQFVELARQLADLGNKAVNWNLGCPYPTMTKKRKGAGLLPYPEAIDRFLDQVCKRLPLTLSVKMRLGMEAPEEYSAILPVLNRYPLQHVTIHARLGIQMYAGPIDLDAFGHCCERLDHPVIYSGDIFSIDDYQRLSTRFPQVRIWMLGRGLLSNPHLLREIKDNRAIPFPDTMTQLALFHRNLFDQYRQRLAGLTHLLQQMLGHWTYWCQGLPNGDKHLKKIRRAKTLTRYYKQTQLALMETTPKTNLEA